MAMSRKKYILLTSQILNATYGSLRHVVIKRAFFVFKKQKKKP